MVRQACSKCKTCTEQSCAAAALQSSDKFDLVYAYSTFTHWSAALQKQWTTELTRVLKPGGLLLFTTHGAYFRDLFLQAEEGERFDRGEPIVRRPGSSGANRCAAFHPLAFVKNELLQERLKLEVFTPGSATQGHEQDAYLVRKV